MSKAYKNLKAIGVVAGAVAVFILLSYAQVARAQEDSKTGFQPVPESLTGYEQALGRQDACPTSLFYCQADGIIVNEPVVNSGTVGQASCQYFEINGRTVEQASCLSQVWACVKGPGGEINVYPLEVKDGCFTQKIWLRYGPGTYSVWVDSNPEKYSGRIYFTVTGQESCPAEDLAFLTPSGYVNSDNPEIIALAQSITAGLQTSTAGQDCKAGEPAQSLSTAQAIHDWVAQNMSYDYALYLTGNHSGVNSSRTILNTRTGLCRDYAFLVAALGRAAGLKTRVVYGQAKVGQPSRLTNENWISHAWNEVYLDGKWVALDTCWDSGYIKDNLFVKSPGRKFFAFETGPGTNHLVENISLD